MWIDRWNLGGRVKCLGVCELCECCCRLGGCEFGGICKFRMEQREVEGTPGVGVALIGRKRFEKLCGVGE